MQTLRKKTSPCKYKNEPTKFLGDGVTFKAKLIGILEVDEARGDRMCQDALYELKMAVRAAGEHKQRINIVITIDGVRLKDEKTGVKILTPLPWLNPDELNPNISAFFIQDCLHHHPVHKISFIAQDVADSRAFGYIYGSPDTSHRFYGIKTDKAASQVVMAMRDLFQAVYELKKREVELAKQNIEQHQLKYGSSYFLDSLSTSSTKSSGTDQLMRLKQIVNKEDQNKNSSKNKPQTSNVIADLMDLELELSSLQQGLSQMERLTPSDPFGPSPSTIQEDPFGDSFTPPPCITTPPPAKLPPPPITGDRRKTMGSTSSAASQSEHWFDKETHELFAYDKTTTSTNNSRIKMNDTTANNLEKSASKDLYDIFTELDPLGTGRSKPYTDKKDFFQELKNPPKKQLKNLNTILTSFSSNSSNIYPEDNNKNEEIKCKYRSVDSDQRVTLSEEYSKFRLKFENSEQFKSSFANITSTSFDSSSSAPVLNQPHQQSQASEESLYHTTIKPSPKTKALFKSLFCDDDIDLTSIPLHQNSSQWNHCQDEASKQKIVINLSRVLANADDTEIDSPVGEESTIPMNPDISSSGAGGDEMSSDSFESIPEPTHHSINSPLGNLMQRPHKNHKPPHSADSISKFKYFDICNRQIQSLDQIPPLPAPLRKTKFQQDSFHKEYARHRPISVESEKNTKPLASSTSLNMTISQLTSTGFNELASILKIPASTLSRMTLKELTQCLSSLSEAECQKIETNVSERNSNKEDFLFKSQLLPPNSIKDESTLTFKANFKDNFPLYSPTKIMSSAPLEVDKYAVFREFIDQEEKLGPTQIIHQVEIKDAVSGEAEKDIAEDSNKYKTFEVTSEEQKYTYENEDKVVETSFPNTMVGEITQLQDEENLVTDAKDEEIQKLKVGDEESKNEAKSNNVGNDWAKFDCEQEIQVAQSSSLLWHGEDEEAKREVESTEKQKKNRPKCKNCCKKMHDDDVSEMEEKAEKSYVRDELEDYGEESENWDSSKSPVSSLDESSWRGENGWSDRDSLDDDTEPPPPRYRRQYPRSQPSKITPIRKHELWNKELMGLREEYQTNSQSHKSCSSSQKPFSPHEENELMLLKMMLGKKRLKALEEKLFKHYHEQLCDKVASSSSKKHGRSGMKSTASVSSLLHDQQFSEYERVNYKKYYTTRRPRSAEKSNKSSFLRQENISQCYTKFKKDSQDELSISEEEKWNTSKVVCDFKKGSSNRSKSQASPFEDDFIPSPGSYNSLAEISHQKFTCRPNSTTSTCTTPSKIPNQHFTTASNKKSQMLEFKKDPQSYSSYKNSTRDQRSHESSQRQSPFEDDFIPDICKLSESETIKDNKSDDDVFFNSRESFVKASKNSSRTSRYDNRFDAESSKTKYYADSDSWRKKSSPGNYYEKTMVTPKERYNKLSLVKKDASSDSPKKNKPGVDAFHDDNAKTMPKSGQNVRNRSRTQSYDSGSDSATQWKEETNSFGHK